MTIDDFDLITGWLEIISRLKKGKPNAKMMKQLKTYFAGLEDQALLLCRNGWIVSATSPANDIIKNKCLVGRHGFEFIDTKSQLETIPKMIQSDPYILEVHHNDGRSLTLGIKPIRIDNKRCSIVSINEVDRKCIKNLSDGIGANVYGLDGDRYIGNR